MRWLDGQGGGISKGRRLQEGQEIVASLPDGRARAATMPRDGDENARRAAVVAAVAALRGFLER